MSDEEWLKFREERYQLMGNPPDNGDLNMIPYLKSWHNGEITTYVSRTYVEQLKKSNSPFKNTVMNPIKFVSEIPLKEVDISNRDNVIQSLMIFYCKFMAENKENGSNFDLRVLDQLEKLKGD